jgi:hypothetical protein
MVAELTVVASSLLSFVITMMLLALLHWYFGEQSDH